jgi:hypothetical protein
VNNFLIRNSVKKKIFFFFHFCFLQKTFYKKNKLILALLSNNHNENLILHSKAGNINVNGKKKANGKKTE